MDGVDGPGNYFGRVRMCCRVGPFFFSLSISLSIATDGWVRVQPQICPVLLELAWPMVVMGPLSNAREAPRSTQRRPVGEHRSMTEKTASGIMELPCTTHPACMTTSRYECACTKTIGRWSAQMHVIIVLPAPINIDLVGRRGAMVVGPTSPARGSSATGHPATPAVGSRCTGPVLGRQTSRVRRRWALTQTGNVNSKLEHPS